MKNICGIYAIICEKLNLCYIGSSVNVKKRWSWHKSMLKKNKHFINEIQEVFNENANNIKFITLEECKEDNIYDKEVIWIEKAKERELKVVNKREVFPRKRITDKETLKRMSAAQRGFKNGNARLTEKEVKEIKRLFKESHSDEEIAEKYHISIGHANKIKYGYRWGHIA